MEVEMEAGLMQQIQALIAPPASESPPKAKRKERDDKRKGKNRDTCDACGDCGSLICCEKCPTAFHMQCLAPPLDDDDIPLGDWACRACKARIFKFRDKKCLDNETFNPIDMLIKATELDNPGVYNIPHRYAPTIKFPRADKDPQKVLSRRSSSNKKIPTETVKLCFVCNRGPRIGQILNCNYCSQCFHLDCLDPPLTVLPPGTWMCPLHVEHFLDANVLKSTSLIERAGIWQDASKVIDEEATKLEFVRHVYRKNPPFRYKVKKPERPRTVIPPAIVQMYANPQPLVPSLPNNVQLRRTWKVDAIPSQEETDDWLSSLFAMQASIAWDLTMKNTKATEAASDEVAPEELMEQMFSSKKKLNRSAIDNFVSQLELGTNASVESLLAKMDTRLLKIMAAQRLQQVLPHLKDKNNLMSKMMLPCADTKVRIKESAGEDVYAVFDDNAFLKNGVICAKKKYVAVKDINGGLRVEEWQEQPRCVKTNEELEEGEVLVQPVAQAALAPIGSTMRISPVTMRYKTLTIGTSPDSDVCLTQFGSCQYTSSKHAKIFYDTMTGEYELLNYSPHGTIVDGCLYCLDATQWRVPTASAPADPLTQNVRSILDKRRGIKREAAPAAPARVARPAPARHACGCEERVSDPTGWEGSALLNHCSYLQFGCLQFVFSIVDFAPSKIINPDDEDKKKRKVEEKEDKDVQMKE